MPDKQHPNYIRQNSLNLKIRVRYSECDAQGVVFNARYADYADLADTEYFRALVGDFTSFMAMGFDKQVVNYQCSWLNAAKFDDILELTAQTTHIGSTSYEVEVKCAKRDKSALIDIATMKIRYVVMERQGWTKTPIPAVLKDSFKRIFNKTIDQTGN